MNRNKHGSNFVRYEMFVLVVHSTEEYNWDSYSAWIYLKKEAFKIAIYGICYLVSSILLLWNTRCTDFSQWH